jgi:hypothetical protein
MDKTTTAEATLMLASPQSLARDCTSLGQVDAKVITPPENGTIDIEKGMSFPGYAHGDAPYVCNTKKASDHDIRSLISRFFRPGHCGRANILP